MSSFEKEQEFYRAKGVRERKDEERRHFEKFKKQYPHLEFSDVIVMSETRVKMKDGKIYELRDEPITTKPIEFDAHVFIGGKTGSGKTVFAVEYFKHNEGLNIFINTNETYYVTDAGDIVVDNISDLLDAINKLESNDIRIVYNPEEAGEDITEKEVATIINMMFAIGSIAKKAVHGDPDYWGTLFIDEVQTWGEKGGCQSVHKLWKRGRGYGIRAVGISQRPADVSHTILTQSYYHVIFYIGDYDHPYFKKYGIPIEDHMEHIEFKSYRFVIWDGTTITRYDKVEYHP